MTGSDMSASALLREPGAGARHGAAEPGGEASPGPARGGAGHSALWEPGATGKGWGYGQGAGFIRDQAELGRRVCAP